MAPTTLGDFIKARRLEMGFTQTGLSSAIGKSTSYMGSVERGLMPSERAFRAIERELQCQLPRSLPNILPTTAGGEPWFKLKRKTRLAEQITRKRLELKYTQGRAAELADVSLSKYRQIEIGSRTPTNKEMMNISAALDLDLQDTTPLTPYVPTRLRNAPAAVQVPYDVVWNIDANSGVAGMTIAISEDSRQDIERILALSGLHSPKTVVERALLMMRRCMEIIAPEERARLAS